MSNQAFHPVSNSMQRPVYAIGPATPVAEVLAVAERLQVHHFPIIAGGDLLGIVCTCDLLEARPDTAVSRWARHDVVTLDPTGTAEQAAALMRDRGVGSVVIAEASGPCGIVTREDLARDPKLALTLDEGHCSACGARKHLRRASNDTFLCVDCSQRAREDSWYDTGGGD